MYHNFIQQDKEASKDLLIIEKVNKNLCLEIKFKNRTGVFVKQNIEKVFDRFVATNIEFEFYKYLWFESDHLFKNSIPKIIGYDERNSILILKRLSILKFRTSKSALLLNAVDLLKSFQTISGFEAVTPKLPWPFEIPDFEMDKIDNYLIQSFKLQDGLLNEIKRVQSSYKFEVLTHGDIKLTNLLSTKGNKVYMVDFDTLSLGDRLWDIASLLQSYYLTFFLENLAHFALFSDPINEFQKYTEVFKAICLAFDPNLTYSDKMKLIKFFGLALIWRCYEISTSSSKNMSINFLSEVARVAIMDSEQIIKYFYDE